MQTETRVKKRKSAAPPAQNLVIRTHAALLQMILNRELLPNQVVRERQLAATLGVSRTPLREALNRLSGERWLLRSDDGVLTVAFVGIDEVLDVLRIRRLLETEAARIAAGRIPQDKIADLLLRIRRMERIGRAEDNELDGDIHFVVADACGSPTLARMITDLWWRTRVASIRNWPDRISDVCSEHRALLEALAVGDGDAAAAAMDTHIERTRRMLIQALSQDGPMRGGRI